MMKSNIVPWSLCAVCTAIAFAFPVTGARAQTTLGSVDAQALPGLLRWSTVANSATVIPGGDGRVFNSFNQPSVNSTGLVVLRARSKGGGTAGEPLHGIYSRQMGGVAGPLTVVFDKMTEVPQPNNTHYSGKLATFTEFPAFPRIGLANKTIASRAQSKPVWTYVLADNTETKAGTSGIYTMRQGEPTGAMTQLGAVPDFGHFGVPAPAAAVAPGTKFDQFPGAPAVAHANAVVFKGNYTDGTTRKTGIFYRMIGSARPPAKAEVIASSNTLIPGDSGVRFGSTAPPSASDIDAVFLGLDNEEAPTMGGIYQAPLATTPPLKTLVSIGSQVPGEPFGPGYTFNRLGEGLAYDGRFVAFWGAWGSATRSVTLACPTEGNKAVIDFCNAIYPGGHTVAIPVNQGFFVHDVRARKTYAVAKTGVEYLDFLYWNFSGRPPGVGEAESEDFEDPRWRSASFVAAYTQSGKAQVAFKGRKPSQVDGIYFTVTPSSTPVMRTVVETGMDGSAIDPQAIGVPVISVGVERDGLRNGWLAISASMASGETGWAGVYLTRTAR
ncbi:MAG: hypothetical protein K0Q43_3959 [Ramlibacter sp.]|jgi:hypothetical protein|nr:hypothetical protein [Ramlibacter sp.]